MYSQYREDIKEVHPALSYYYYSNVWLRSKGLRNIGGNQGHRAFTLNWPFILKRKAEILIIEDDTLDVDFSNVYDRGRKVCRLRISRYRKESLCDADLTFFYKLMDWIPLLAMKVPILYRMALMLRRYYRLVFWRVFFRIYSKVDCVYMTDSYIRVEAIEAFRRNSEGLVYEYKHGVVTPEHAGYGFWIEGGSRLYRPDYMIYKGDHYNLVSINDENLLRLNGYKHRDATNKSHANQNLGELLRLYERRPIVLISQPTMREYVEELYSELEEAGYQVYIRPHPKDSWNVKRWKLKRDLDRNHLFIGWYSTFILDLLELEMDVYVVNGFWNILRPLLNEELMVYND